MSLMKRGIEMEMNKSTKMDFNNSINKVDDIVNFSHRKGCNHNAYHHYTTLDNCLKILQSNYFHLTRGNLSSMNDHHEPTKGSSEVWKRTYIGSFSYGSNENMAMWGLYGLPWSEAVRISLPRKAMNEWINNSDQIYSVVFKEKIMSRIPLSEDFQINLADVIYIEGEKNNDSYKLKYRRNSFNLSEKPELVSVNNHPKITGYIKNVAWEYENEVRIRICLDTQTDDERLAIPIADTIIEKMTIMAGPYFQGDLKQMIEKKLESYAASDFTNLVNYRSLCDNCIHDSYVRKQT